MENAPREPSDEAEAVPRSNRFPPIVFTPEEAAEALGVSVRTLHTLVTQFNLPYVQVGKALKRFRPAALRKWAKDNETLATAPTKREDETAEEEVAGTLANGRHQRDN
jgi:excisionase family DNA binding protein